MTQVLSEPNLGKPFQDSVHDDTKELDGPRRTFATPYRQSCTNLRSDLADLLGTLDVQCGERREQQKREAHILKVQQWSRVQQKKQMQREFENQNKDKVPFAPPKAPDYFQRPIVDDSPATNHTVNALHQGIFNTPGWYATHQEPPKKGWSHPPCKAAGWVPEPDTKGGWDDGTKNAYRGHKGEFAEKPRHQLSEKELKFATKRDQAVNKATVLSHRDTMIRTSGALKKQLLEATVEPFSCLKKDQDAWVLQRVTNHETFSDPPKDKEYLHLDVLKDFVVASARRTDPSLDIVAGDPYRTNFWRQPKGKTVGTTRRHQEAQLLTTPACALRARAEAERHQRMVEEQRKASMGLSKTPAGSKAEPGLLGQRSASMGALSTNVAAVR